MHVNKFRLLHVVRMTANLQYHALTQHNLQTRRAQMNPFNTGGGIQFQLTMHCYCDRYRSSDKKR